MLEDKNGVIYIITNEVLPHYLKIGYTEDINQTVQQMNKESEVKGAYNVYATYETKAVVNEKQLYKLFGSVSTIETRTGKNSTIDYIKMEPEDAYSRLFIMAKLSGTMNMLHKGNVSVSREVKVEKTGVECQGRKRKPNLKFSQYNIPIGSILEFVNDSTKKVKVVSEYLIEYNGEKMSVSACAKRLLNNNYPVQGTLYFKYKGKTLSEIRTELGV